MHLTCREPSPVEAAFVGNNIPWPLVYGHGEHAPPVMLAVTKAHLVCVPPRARGKIGTDQPSAKENGIVYRS